MSPPAAQPGKRGHVVSYGDDRVCANPDCTTQLSRYNRNDHCALHDGTARERPEAEAPSGREATSRKA